MGLIRVFFTTSLLFFSLLILASASDYGYGGNPEGDKPKSPEYNHESKSEDKFKVGYSYTSKSFDKETSKPEDRQCTSHQEVDKSKFKEKSYKVDEYSKSEGHDQAEKGHDYKSYMDKSESVVNGYVPKEIHQQPTDNGYAPKHEDGTPKSEANKPQPKDNGYTSNPTAYNPQPKDNDFASKPEADKPQPKDNSYGANPETYKAQPKNNDYNPKPEGATYNRKLVAFKSKSVKYHGHDSKLDYDKSKSEEKEKSNGY